MKNKEFGECNICAKEFKKYKTTDKYCSWNCANIGEKEKEKAKAKRPKPISPIGASRQKLLNEYRPKRDAFMKKHKKCQFDGCVKHSEDLHHKAGRIGLNLTDERNFMAVCRKHHNWIHEHPQHARILGYLI